MFRAVRASAKEFADFDLGPLAAGRKIGLVDDKSPAIGAVAGEKPAISVGTKIEFPQRRVLRCSVPPDQTTNTTIGLAVASGKLDTASSPTMASEHVGSGEGQNRERLLKGENFTQYL